MNLKVCPRISLASILVVTLLTQAVEARPACRNHHMALCMGNPAVAPNVHAAARLIGVARRNGLVTTLDSCQHIARDAGRLSGLINNSVVAGIVAGRCGECACRMAF
jgi:hypothetical protein